MAKEPVVGKSLDEIAQMMADNRAKAIEAKAVEDGVTAAPAALDEVAGTQLGGVDETDDVGSEAGEEEQELQQEEEAEDEIAEAEGDSEAAVEDGEEDSTEYERADFEVSDDDLFEIEGLDEPISLADLKARYTSDETITQTLAATQEANQAASAAHQKAQEDSAIIGEAMQALVGQIDGMLAQPLVEPPNEALKTSNPAQYIQQTELYQQDQQRIAEGREAVQLALNDFGDHRKELDKKRRGHEMTLLANVIPEMKVATTRDKVATDIMQAAKYYGFTQAEVTAQAVDHRIFHMAHDAAKYHALMAEQSEGQGEKVNELKQTIKTKPRVMRTRGTSARAQSKTAAKRVIAAKKVAAASGRPDDVAAFMAQKRQAR